MQVHSFFSLLCLFCFFSTVGALFGYGLIRCQFTSNHEVVYLEQIYLNKVLLIQYNSTLGKVMGYTEKSKEIADSLNKNPAFLRRRRKDSEKCITHMPLVMDVLSKAVEPYVRLRSVEAASSKHPAMLVCSVYDFYPKQIRMTWLRDGKTVTSDVTSTDELPNGNWLYQMHSYLEYTPSPGEKITCVVEHASFMSPRLYDWDPIHESDRNKIAAGTGGLLLGLIFLLAGVIYCQKNTTGRLLVPTS